MNKGVGYLVDESHPPLVFAAVQGLGEVLEHGLRMLSQAERDVSPIISESRDRLVVINLYEPEPATIQVIQHEGHLERMTEIVGAGIGMNVLRELRRAARVLEVEVAPLGRRFRNRFEKERATYLMTYSLFKGDASRKQSSFREVLRRMQEKYRRESEHQGGPGRDGQVLNPSFLFHLTFPKAVRELERSIRLVLSGSWDRPVLEHVAEVASALAEACRAEGLRETSLVARSISSLVSVSPKELRAVEKTFREKLGELLSSLRGEADAPSNPTASSAAR